MVRLLMTNDVTSAAEDLSADVTGVRLALVLVLRVPAQRVPARKQKAAVQALERAPVLFRYVLRVLRAHVLHQARQSSELSAADVAGPVSLGLVQLTVDPQRLGRSENLPADVAGVHESKVLRLDVVVQVLFVAERARTELADEALVHLVDGNSRMARPDVLRERHESGARVLTQAAGSLAMISHPMVNLVSLGIKRYVTVATTERP